MEAGATCLKSSISHNIAFKIFDFTIYIMYGVSVVRRETEEKTQDILTMTEMIKDCLDSKEDYAAICWLKCSSTTATLTVVYI